MGVTRCYYEILGVPRDVTNDELKTTYRKLALRWHPDKNLHQMELAEEKFKEIRMAYEILSNSQERSWYDSHRDSILAGGDGTNASNAEDDGSYIWAYFGSGCFSDFSDGENGFYYVYSNLFEKIDIREKSFNPARSQAPPFGDSTSDFLSVVAPFYNHWSNFISDRSFAWKDKYNTTQAPNREIRKLMERDNMKEREKGRKEFIQIVRRLVKLLKTRDPRVISWKELQLKLQKEKELAKFKAMKSQEKKVRELKMASKIYQQEMLDKINFSEIDLSLIMTVKDMKKYGFMEAEEVDDLFCNACNKNFKTLGQFESHKNSKKHKNNVQLAGKIEEAEEVSKKEDEIILDSLDRMDRINELFDDFQELKAQSCDDNDGESEEHNGEFLKVSSEADERLKGDNKCEDSIHPDNSEKVDKNLKESPFSDNDCSSDSKIKEKSTEKVKDNFNSNILESSGEIFEESVKSDDQSDIKDLKFSMNRFKLESDSSESEEDTMLKTIYSRNNKRKEFLDIYEKVNETISSMKSGLEQEKQDLSNSSLNGKEKSRKVNKTRNLNSATTKKVSAKKTAQVSRKKKK